jgi:hypothetical protein
MDDSSGRVPTKQAWGSEFKPQYWKKTHMTQTNCPMTPPQFSSSQ